MFGTIIAVYKGEGYTCVCVLEGTVRVGLDEADLEEIPHEMLKVMLGGAGQAFVTAIDLGHKAGLLTFRERYEHALESPE